MRPSAIHTFFAHGLKLATWGTSLAAACLVIRYGAPTLTLLGIASYVLPFLAALLAAALLGWMLGAIFVWPVILLIGSVVNSAPLRIGDRVHILVGPYRGRTARVILLEDMRAFVSLGIAEGEKIDATATFFVNEVYRKRRSG